MDSGEHHRTDSGDGRADAEPDTSCDGPLDCRDCPDYAPAKQVCTDFESSSWHARYEGDCGDFRYRFEGSWYAGTVSYWERETGKLVAVHSFTDSNVPCQQSVSGDRSVYEQCQVPPAREVCAAADADAGADDGV